MTVPRTSGSGSHASSRRSNLRGLVRLLRLIAAGAQFVAGWIAHKGGIIVRDKTILDAANAWLALIVAAVVECRSVELIDCLSARRIEANHRAVAVGSRQEIDRSQDPDAGSVPFGTIPDLGAKLLQPHITEWLQYCVVKFAAGFQIVRTEGGVQQHVALPLKCAGTGGFVPSREDCVELNRLAPPYP